MVALITQALILKNLSAPYFTRITKHLGNSPADNRKPNGLCVKPIAKAGAGKRYYKY